MGSITTYSLIAGILGLVIFLTGFWLRKTGEPYKKGIFALHKLAGAGVAVLLVLVIVQHLQFLQIRGTGLVLSLFSAVFFIIAVVSGGLLAAGNMAKFFWKTIHRISSVLILLMAGVIWWYCH